MSTEKEYNERKARALNNKFEGAEKALNELEMALSKLSVKEIKEINVYIEEGIEDHNFDPDYYSASVWLTLKLRRRAKEIYKFLSACEGFYLP